MEDELGVFLFDRSTAGARLTPTGEEFVVHAHRIVEDVRRLTEQAKASGVGWRGESSSASTSRSRSASCAPLSTISAGIIRKSRSNRSRIPSSNCGPAWLSAFGTPEAPSDLKRHKLHPLHPVGPCRPLGIPQGR
ncbi:hypothetical protein ACUSIJ_23370 [Pseudochelatococcus sp. B33]